MTENADVTIYTNFDDNDLRNLESFSDAMLLVQNATGEAPVDAADVLGNGFEIVEKSTLVDVPMILISWRFNVGDKGVFTSVMAMTENGRKVIFNDGSTGIRDQLNAYTSQTGKTAGLLLRHGLTVSEYPVDKDGKPTKVREEMAGTAKTYYLNYSK